MLQSPQSGCFAFMENRKRNRRCTTNAIGKFDSVTLFLEVATDGGHCQTRIPIRQCCLR